jgi:ATP-dependent DNA helicase PIF1
MKHSEGQERALALFHQGENLFLSGPGGSGKTTLIRHIYRDALEKNIPIQVVALTGCAAVLLGCRARTLHSFAGIGLGNGTLGEVVARVRKNRRACASWRSVRVLVVDEVSMMSKRLFETLDHVARVIRKRPQEPFGGIQVIFSGDFFQIRPVGDGRDPDTSAYCFESALWGQTFLHRHHILLQQIFRQTDPVYTEVLNAVREGRLEQRHIDIMKTRVNRPVQTDIRPTKLFPTRRQVDLINQQELERLSPEGETLYAMKDHVDQGCGHTPEEVQRELDYLRKNVLCEESLRLREGAQVMSVVNKDGLCNGSRGVVVGFDNGLPVVRFHNGVEAVMSPHVWKSEALPGVGISQVPLIISYACTIHKCQGSTLDVAEVDVGRFVFECGQTYVALSRLRGLEGLFLTDFDPSSVLVDPKVVVFYQNLQ